MARIPALARPIAIGASTITIDYDGATTEVISVAAVTRYNDLSGDAASDLWAYVLAAINAGSAFTWVAETVANRPYGRRRLAINGAPDFVVRLYAANALECYRLDSDFIVGQGDLLTTDPHYSWEAFRRGWLQAGGSARYYPDRATPATYNTVQPRAPWIASSSQGLSEFRTNPLTFNLSIEMVQTS
jgi:hypothetical protein